jgi:broad specificity phosphatase PhoE
MALWLVRHGETEWSLSGQHTGRTDVPLTPEGELQAVAIGKMLASRAFDRVVSSPMTRARDTGRLAGFGERLEIVEDLVEVDYGEYEGLTTHEIHEREPAWELFGDGSPGGDTPHDIERRVDELLARLDGDETNTLAFGHGHCFRALAARFLGLGVGMAAQLRLDAGSISVLAHERDGATIVLWNRRVPPRPILVGDIAIRVPDVTG